MRKIILILAALLALGAAGCANRGILPAPTPAAPLPTVTIPDLTAGIGAVTALPRQASWETILYRNTEYGFDFALPAGWAGYRVSAGQWEGLAIPPGQTREQGVAVGPLLTIRHPGWTAANPRQDIPILVLTHDQWNALAKGDFHIGAAPIGPSELGRNSRYVFALPARYNFACLPGYEEVEQILAGNPLRPTEMF